MDTRRIDHVTVVTPDPGAAQADFQRTFGFSSAATAGGESAVRVGSARIEFLTPDPGTALGSVLATGGEGMAELCLEVASLDQAAQTLDRARVPHTRDNSIWRRSVHIDPSAAHGVRLTLVERG